MTEQQPEAEDQRDAREQAVVERVVASFAETPDPRHRELFTALVRHAHALVRETRPTEAEWEAVIGFLTRCGHITDERRQEFVLLSDVLGLSMQTITVNEPDDTRATEQTVFGPFFAEAAPEIAIGGDVAQGAPGQPCWVSGTVRDVDGAPVADALLDVWEADDEGLYDVQHDDGRVAGRARLRTDAEGRYAFWCVTPTPYPIPHDGPVGDLLAAGGRGPMRAAHLHLMVTAPGMHRLVTHIFVRGDAHQDSDAVFGVKESLVVDFTEHPAGETPPDGTPRDVAWASADFDVVLAPEETR